MGHWKCYFLISTITSYVIAVSDMSLSTSLLNRASTKVLSRKRRFFIPQTSGWNLRFVLNTNSVNYLKIVIAGRLIIILPLCSKFIPCSKIKIRLYHCFTFFLYSGAYLILLFRLKVERVDQFYLDYPLLITLTKDGMYHFINIFPLFILILIRATFSVIIPIEDNNGGPLVITMPITYNVDSGS